MARIPNGDCTGAITFLRSQFVVCPFLNQQNHTGPGPRVGWPNTGAIAGLVGIAKHIVVTKSDGTHVLPPWELLCNEWPYGIPKRDSKEGC